MGDLERRLQELSRQRAIGRVEAAARERERLREEQQKEVERQERLKRAKALGMEMVELLQKHNIPVVPLWKATTISADRIPAHLRHGQEVQPQTTYYPVSIPGWRIAEHYVHLSDYSGGVTTRYALSTDGRPYTYSAVRSRRYPYLPQHADNPVIEGAVDITEIYSVRTPTDNSSEVVNLLSSAVFLGGVLSLVEEGSPASTMYDSAYPFRNK